MGKVTCAAPHLSIDEVKGKLRTSINFWMHQKWAVMYTALVDPRPAAAIALHLGVSVPFVQKIISLYKRFGPAGLETPGSGGRRHQYLTLEEEQQFIAPFLQRAASGEMATISAIKSTFEAHVRQAVHKTTISRLLSRHGWRKIAPRARHPAATPNIQDAFKKTFLPPSKQPCTPARPMIRDRSSRWPKMNAVSAVSVRPNAAGPRQECAPKPRDRWCGSTCMPIRPWRQSRGP
jgi:transposase